MLKGGLKKIRFEGQWRKAAARLLLLVAACAVSPAAHAVTNLRQVQISNGSQIDLLFDGKIQKGQIRTEFINDIIQISIQDVSVYPAKISSVNGGALTKIFAYQYAPKLVRCRLTVKGKAEDYKNKLEVKAGGRILTVRMQDDTPQVAPGRGGDQSPAAKARVTSQHQAVTSAATGGEPDPEERALLSRVMAASAPSAQVLAAAPAVRAAAAPAAEKPGKDSITVSAAAPASAASSDGAPHTENQPIHLTGEGSSKLGGAKPLPSPLKAFGKMGIVLGLFGLFAFGLKRYAQNRAGSRVSSPSALAEAASKGGWLGSLGQLAKKGLSRNGKMIEVLSTHYLGPKKSIAVVRVAGRVLVLGVSNESINLITQLSGEDAADPMSGMDALNLGDLGALGVTTPSPAPAAPTRPARSAPSPAAAPGLGAMAAGPAGFADLLHAERAKPAFANPSGPSVYAGAAPAANKANPNVRAQIRNRLEGLKQL